MEDLLIGRKRHIAELKEARASKKPELVALIGRRRIGKTYLVKQVYAQQIDFELIGSQHSTMSSQIQNFMLNIGKYFPDFEIRHKPSSWTEAFHLLGQALETVKKTEKKIIFFDELPWLDTKRSNFVAGLSYFWNNWAVNQNIVVVICGSAASWMIQKVVNDRGGLHNRITKRVHLEPFTLNETEAYFQSKNIIFDKYQIVKLYMAMGGIPHYLKEIDPALSAVQNIDAICFSKQGLLSDEFNRLYPSLFANADNHITVVRTLSQKKQGMTRSQISEIGKLGNGGGLSKVLEELTQSGFISDYFPFGKKKKEKLYRLTDEYSLFYLQFIERHRFQGGNIWQHLSQTPAYKTWSGYAFESICLKHVERIKQALGISGIYTLAASFHKKGTDTDEGVQIDMVFDRNDHTINLFEIKFYNKPFTISKDYAEQLRQTTWNFQAETKTVKQVNWVFITTFGLVPNVHALGLIAKTLTLDDLF